MIDVNLPISGTLTDPDFSVGGIVMWVIVNLLQKVPSMHLTIGPRLWR